MKHLQISPTPSELSKLREKVAMRHNVQRSRMSEQKLRILSLYEKIQKVNECDPLYNLSSSDLLPDKNKKISDNKKQMRKTHAQNQKFDRYSTLVNSFIEGLDSPIKKQNSQDEIRADCYKMSILKTLLSKYNSRFLGQGNYLKLINSFGLQIQPMKNLKRFRTTSAKQKQRIYKQQNLSEIKVLDKQKYKYKQKTSLKQNLLKQHKNDKIDNISIYQNTQIEELNNLVDKNDFYQQAKSMYKTSIVPNKDIRFRKNNQRKGISQTITKRTSVTEDKDKYFSKREIEEHNFQNRLCKYRQFLFVINYSNGIYRNLEINQYSKPIKFYVGRGNNSNLIRSIVKNRFWWEEGSLEEANFVWTQIKIDTLFDLQNIYMKQIQYLQIDSQLNASKMLDNKQTIDPFKKGVKMVEPQIPQLKLLSQTQNIQYTSMWKNHNPRSYFQNRIKGLKSIKMQQAYPSPDIVHNHLPRNQLLGNKKAMFYCLKQYYKLINKNVFDIVPLTYHIQNGEKDTQFKQFVQEFNKRKVSNRSNVWIIKPGQFTNRGNGISCSNNLKQIKELVCRKMNKNGEKRTFILQSYLTRPLLYHRRKFDIRVYMLLTSTNGRMKGYWYQDGYVRTSSSMFNLNELDDPMIHLTNDAVQKNGQSYGRFQDGNKISYNQLQRYIQTLTNKVDFFTMIYPQIRKIATDSIKSAAIHLDSLKHQSNFELFGLDFMIDQDYKPWLIQINTNPCLQLSCGILQRLIPHLIQNVIRIAIDPIFPPPSNYPFTKRYNVLQNALHYNKFQLVYDQIRDGKQLFVLFQNSKVLQMIGQVKEDQELFENEGEVIGIDQVL